MENFKTITTHEGAFSKYQINNKGKVYDTGFKKFLPLRDTLELWSTIENRKVSVNVREIVKKLFPPAEMNEPTAEVTSVTVGFWNGWSKEKCIQWYLDLKVAGNAWTKYYKTKEEKENHWFNENGYLLYLTFFEKEQAGIPIDQPLPLR